ncbi:cupin domain-containing protein [Bradyrhizobium sp. BR13661]|nr:cupin domain-containing protein [Bradyrhizobium sp. BR13661]MDH6261738.1 transcriptional regulator with XRE-family HTH domain [Bradyrhizobium sp. BR13661]
MQAKVTKSRRGKTPAKMLSKNQPADLDRESGLLIGARLKHARLNRRISLRQLADDVGCTESFLSKVENDKVRPSLTMLHTIVKSLGINIAKLFSEPDSAVVTVLKAGKRVTLQTEQAPLGKGITLESLLPIPLAVLLEANIHHVEPGSSTDGFIDHKGEEMGFVLEGELDLTVDGRTVKVQKGDSFFFQSHLPHGYRNPGTATTKILWVNTPQSF